MLCVFTTSFVLSYHHTTVLMYNEPRYTTPTPPISPYLQHPSNPYCSLLPSYSLPKTSPMCPRIVTIMHPAQPDHTALLPPQPPYCRPYCRPTAPSWHNIATILPPYWRPTAPTHPPYCPHNPPTATAHTPYCPPTAPLLPPTVPPLSPYCHPTATLLGPYCPPTGPLLPRTCPPTSPSHTH